MPTKERKEDRLIEMFLAAYEGRAWDGCEIRWLDRELDGAVEVIATKSDATTLAIEHTVIEFFIGEKDDFARSSRFLRVAADRSLQVPGRFIYVSVKTVRGVQELPVDTCGCASDTSNCEPDQNDLGGVLSLAAESNPAFIYARRKRLVD